MLLCLMALMVLMVFEGLMGLMVFCLVQKQIYRPFKDIISKILSPSTKSVIFKTYRAERNSLQPHQWNLHCYSLLSQTLLGILIVSVIAWKTICMDDSSSLLF